MKTEKKSMLSMKLIEFKSTKENYEKEEDGIKNNTFRKVDENDPRFKVLKEFSELDTFDKCFCCPLHIAISHYEDGKEIAYFVREVSDVTFWDGYCIITWWKKESE